MAFVWGYNTSPRLGVDLALKGTTKLHPLGTKVQDNYGREWIYVKAGGTIPIHNLAKAALSNTPFDGVVVGTATASADIIVGCTPQALASGDYAWIVHKGVYQDDAEVDSAGITANGQPFECNAGGGATIAAAASINNAGGVVLVDDTDNTGTLLLS